MALSLNEVLGTPNSLSNENTGQELELNPFFETSNWNQGQPNNNPLKKSAIKNPNALTDSIINLGQGVLKLPGELAGLGDVAAGLVGFNRPFGKAADYVADKTGLHLTQMANNADNDLSPELKASKSNIDKAWKDGGAGNIAAAYAKNPRASVSNIFESWPMMTASGIVGKGAALALPALADTVAAGKVVKSMAPARYALGDAALTAGNTMSNIDQNVDPQKAAVASLADGTFTGAIDLASGKLANKLGLENAGNLLAGQSLSHAAEQKALHPALRLGGGAALGSGEELLQNPVDQLAQNAAEGNPWSQGLARAGVEGAIVGGAMGMGANAMSPGTYFQPVLDKRTNKKPADELDTNNAGEEVSPELQAERQRQADDLTQKAKNKEAKNAGKQASSATETGVVADTGGTTDSVDGRDAERSKATLGENGESGDTDNLPDKASLIVKANGEPFATETTAKRSSKVRGLDSSHEIIPHEGGFALKPNTTEEPSESNSTDHAGANGVDAAGVDASGSQDAAAKGTDSKITEAATKPAEIKGAAKAGGNAGLNPTHELSDGTPVIKEDDGSFTDEHGDNYADDGHVDVLKPNSTDAKTKNQQVPVPASSDKVAAPKSGTTEKVESVPVQTGSDTFNDKTNEKIGENNDQHGQAKNEAPKEKVGTEEPSDSIQGLIKKSDGNPFDTEAKANQALKNRKNLNPDEHDIVPVDGGFAIAPTKSLSFSQFKALPRNKTFSDDVLAQTYEDETGNKPDVTASIDATANEVATGLGSESSGLPNTEAQRKEGVIEHPVTKDARGVFETHKSQGKGAAAAHFAHVVEKNGLKNWESSALSSEYNALVKSDPGLNDESGHYVSGTKAFLEGNPRQLPDYFTTPKGKNAKDWMRGYDSAKSWTPQGTKNSGSDAGTKNNGSDASIEKAIKDTNEEITHAGQRIYRQEFKDGNHFVVETEENKTRRLSGERTIGGDVLFNTLDEAKSYAESAQARYRDHIKSATRRLEDEKEAREQTIINDDTDGFADRFKPLQRGTVIKKLNSQVNIGGKVDNLKGHVKALLAKGETPNTREENKIKDKSRTEWNRMDNRQQAEHERKVKDGGKSAVHSVGGYNLGKTAHDYAVYLIDKEKSHVPETNFGNTETNPKADDSKSKEEPKKDNQSADETTGNTSTDVSKNKEPVNKFIKDLETQSAKPETKSKDNEHSADYLKAKSDLDEALGDLGEVFLSANLFAKKAIATKISAKDLIPVLTRVMDAAFRMGYADFKANAKFVLDTIREKFGDPAADSITIGHLQGSYIAMGDGTTLPKDVVNFTSIDELNSPDQENNDASGDDRLKDGNDGVQDLGADGTEEIRGGRRGTVASNGNDIKAGADEGILEGVPTKDVPQASSHEPGGQSDPSAGMQDAGSGRKEPKVGDSVAGQQEPSGAGLATDGTGERGQHGKQRVSDKDKALVDGDIQTRLGNYHISDPEALIGGTPKVRFARNKKAIETYQMVLEENREPTPEERNAIAAYIGWGSFGQDLFQGTFDRPVKRDGWDAEGQWLRQHLGESAWKSAQASIINAHYTDPPTVKALWDMAQKLGFTGGRVLEPSLGIGNFFGLMPPDLMERSSLTGIELDETAGGMAKMLYPDANIQVKGYQESKTADGFYDLVIGNWPFAEKAPSDHRYNKLNLTLHDYFFAKTLDQVRPGGLVIGITSAGTMDKVGKLARRDMVKKGVLVAAFRMPTGAFDKYAGTSVVADIIILQKHGEGVAVNNGEAWKEIEKLKDADGKELTRRDGSTVNVNQYWTKNSTNVLGNMTVGHGSTTFRDGMIVQRQDDYAQVLDRLADRLPENIMTPRTNTENVSYITNNTKDRQNSVVKGENGKLYIVKGDRLALLDDIAEYAVKSTVETANRKDQINRLVSMRQAYGKLIDFERAGNDNAEELRKELNKQYQAFVKKHGVLNDSYGLKVLYKVNDPFFPALAALENNTGTKENPVYTPARILTKPTMRGKSIPDNPSVVDAFIQARNENADFIDVNRIAELSKTPVEQVVKELTDSNALFKTPSGNYEVGDVYLSGNVRQKMREAIDAQESGHDMSHNIAALKKVIPKDTPYFAIEASLGANWVGAKYYQQFIADLLGVTGRDMDDIDVQLMPKGWRIKMEGWLNAKPEAKTIWGVSFHPFSKIVNAAFNGGLITIRAKDADGTVFVDEAATKQANEKVDALREEFKNWVWKDAERRVAMEKAFNETMNAFATPHYDGSFMSFVGMALQKGKNEFSLRKHQIDAIWRGVANGRGLFAHEVGTGKTYTIGGIAVESRRYGIAKKPIIFAHNANSASVASDIQGMYPGAKILYIDNLAPAMIKQRMYQIANDDWDAVVVPHSLLDRFALTRETLMRIAERDIMALEEEAIASAEEEGFNIEGIMDDEEALRKVRGATTAKQLVKERNRIINEINKMSDRASREDSIAFEQLGIDMIIVDEAHEFKKPPISTRLRVKGLNTSASSNGIAMHLLTTYIRNLNNGKGVHTFTGTPITNTLNEIYNQMRYVMGDTMDEAGVSEWDSWFNTFASKVSDVELTPTGEYEAVTKLTAFNNVAELRRFAGQYMDIVFADEMPEFVSRATESGKTLLDNDLSEAEKDTLLNGRTENPVGRPYKKVVNETAPMTPVQRGILSELAQLARMFKNASRKDRRRLMIEGHPSSPVQVETNAAKAGFDARLYDLEHSDDPKNKINRAVKNVMIHYKEHDLATQVIFMDKGYNDTVDRERSDGQGGKIRTRYNVFNAAKDIVNKLVAQGIPKEHIAVVTGATAKGTRKEIADNMNTGKIRVVIGGTQTLGVGVNMQDNLRAMHHLDAPWMPGELEQRNGRGHRQGNKWNTVMEYRYLTEGIDGRRWQVLAIKQKFITAFLKADEDTRTIEGDAVDLSEADGIDDISASLSAAAGDPRLMMREKLRGDVNRLENRQRTHDFGIVDAINTAHRLKRKVELLQEKSAKSTDDAEHYTKEKEKPFSIEVRSKIFTDRKDVDGALIKAHGQSINGSRVGLFMDFEILRQGDGLVLRREGGYSSSLSLRSIEANLRNIGKHVENDNKQIEEVEQSIKRMNQAAKTPFGMAATLEKKRAMLAQLVNDLSLYPAPAPSWLRNGSPVGTDVYIRVKSEKDDSIENKKVTVQGHRWGNDNWYVLVDDGKGEAEALPYTDIMDENNTPVYEARGFEKSLIEATKPNSDSDTGSTQPTTAPGQPLSTPKGVKVGDTLIDEAGTHYHVDRLIKPDNDTGRESDWSLEAHALDTGDVSILNVGDIHVETGNDNDNAYNDLSSIRVSSKEELADATIARVIQEAEDKAGIPSNVKRIIYTRELKEIFTNLEAEDITRDGALSRISDVYEEMVIGSKAKQFKSRVARVRGSDFIRQKLLEAKRRGHISKEESNFAEWFIQQNPGLIDDLGILIRNPKNDEGIDGNYNITARLMTIIKSHSGDTTAVHEMLHHLERMMPDEMQDAIKKAWLGKLIKARAKAEKTGKTDLVKFFDHALLGSTEKAIKSLRDSGEIADFYQFTNPSEFWAANGTKILHDRFADQSVIGKIKTWLREAYQHIKAFFGLASNAPILRAIDNLLNNKDPSFITESMLNENNDGKVLASLENLSANSGSQNTEETSQHDGTLKGRAQAHVQNVGNWFGKFGVLGAMPEQNKYLAQRYLTLGNLAKVEEISKDVYATFSKASKEDAAAIYRYLTTRGATVDEIHSVDLRKAAKDIKQTITAIGQQLVDRGFLDQQTYDEHEGTYLPRVYLKHILGDDIFKALGSGKSASDLGYLKQRKDIPEEVRRLILMEIKDPAYLTGRALNIPLRDIAIFDWFNQIADNKNWVWDQSYIKIGLNNKNQPTVLINSDGQGFNLYDKNNPNATKEEAIQTKRDRRFKIPSFKPIKVKPTMKIRKVTPFWMATEAERMRRLAYAAPEADREDILATATYFEFMANSAIKRMGEATEPKDFIQMPKSARYGALAGLVVRKEIHDDLVGTMSMFQGEPSIAQKILGDGGVLAKYTSLWKWAKVAANPPSQVRNIMSNLVLLQLSGVSFHKVPQRVLQAIDEIRNGGVHWDIAKQYGVTQSTFANTELLRMNRELNELILRNQDSNSWAKMKAVVNFYAGRFVDKTGDMYQFMEGVGKVAKIIDEMDKGSSAEKAALAAHEALFDYSLVQPSVRYLRNAPIGIPFATFYVKALPQLVKVAVTHPERYLPYILMFKALSVLVAAQHDVDEDDLDKLKLALPTFLQEKGHAYFLPWKDANGRWQAMDFGYFVPWTLFTELGKNVAAGDANEAMKTLGILGSPVADLITAIKTGVDPFTQKPIVDKFGTPAGKLADILTYLWRMNMPTFITDIGAAGKIMENLTGQVDKQGDPKSTMGQALLRLGGVNIYGIDPEKTRAKNIRFKRFEMTKEQIAFQSAMRDRNISDAKRQRIVARYVKTITSMANDLSQYAKDSEINPKLKLDSQKH